MIISKTSEGSFVAGELCDGEVSGETLPEYIFWIPVRVRYRARFTSSSITAAIIMVKCGSKKWAV